MESDIRVPARFLQVLLDAVTASKWMVCSGEDRVDELYCTEMEEHEQFILGQARDSGQVKDVWRDPVDGALHHPDFEEHRGIAWQAMEKYREECFWMDLAEGLAHVLARREGLGDGRIDDHKQQVGRLFEAWGLECLMLVPTASAG